MDRRPALLDEDNEDEVPEINTNKELSERDWKILLSGATLESCKKDALILQQGSHNRCIYRINKGIYRWQFHITVNYFCCVTLWKKDQFVLKEWMMV